MKTGDIVITRLYPFTYCHKHKTEKLTIGIGDEDSCDALWRYLCLKCLQDRVVQSERGQVVLVKSVEIPERETTPLPANKQEAR